MARRCPPPAPTLLLLVLTSFLVAGRTGASVESPGQPARLYLPTVQRAPEAWPPLEESYRSLQVFSAPTDRPAAQHPDLNLALRGWSSVAAELLLVDYEGEHDARAPQLATLLMPARAPIFRRTYRVHDWPPPEGSGAPLTDFEVTLVEVAASPGEAVRVPVSGYDIGHGYAALVLYADEGRLTLKYGREDNVACGYALHLEGVAVEPALLALYAQCDVAGRGHLPALRAGQAVGRAAGDAVGVAVRDTGRFMDPRSRKDWWQAY